MKLKKQKAQKMCHKKKIKFDNYRNRLEEIKLENKIKYLEKNKSIIDILKKIINNS